MRYQEFTGGVAVTEEIEGHSAMCYHRTSSVEVIQSIGAEGFKIGQDTAATYGRGVYMTYDFRSQQRPRMIETYGDHMVRCQVDLRGFMILDSVVARGVYGDDWHPKDQWRVLGLPRPDLIDGFDTIMKGERYTSVAARWRASYWDHMPGLKGIVFTGKTDGRVAVAFDASIVHPVSYALVKNPRQKLTQVRWTPV